MPLLKHGATGLAILSFTLAIAGCGGTAKSTSPATTLSARYSFTLLPPLPGGSGSQALVINSSGVTAGFSTVNGLPEATEWMNATPVDLGPGYVLAINDSGALAGLVVGTDGHNEAAHWDSGSQVSTIIPTPSGFDSSLATGIDADGTVTGTAFNSFDVSQMEGFVWTAAGGLVPVPQLLESFAINGGVLAGLAPNFNAATVSVASMTPTDLGVRGDALALNSQGDVVGFTNGNTTQVFVWQKGQLTLLGTGNTSLSTALGINSAGVIVGYLEQPEGNVRASRRDTKVGMQRILNPTIGGNVFAMGWTKQEGFVQLANRVSSAGSWALNYADGINDSGQIVGTASHTLGDGTVKTTGFLLGPQ
jgi:uncharacterized membrane protein